MYGGTGQPLHLTFAVQRTQQIGFRCRFSVCCFTLGAGLTSSAVVVSALQDEEDAGTVEEVS